MKKSQIFIVSILIVGILATSTFLCACHKDDDTEQPAIKIYKYPDFNIIPGNYSTIINCAEDIYTLCDEDSSPIFDKKQDERNREIIEKLKVYDEVFFETKSLVIIFKLQGGGNYSVKDFEIIDESLNVTVIRETPKNTMYPGIPNTCLYLLEFPKEQVKDVSQINVNEIRIQK